LFIVVFTFIFLPLSQKKTGKYMATLGCPMRIYEFRQQPPVKSAALEGVLEGKKKGLPAVAKNHKTGDHRRDKGRVGR